MEQKQISLEEVYHRLIMIEKVLQSKGITIENEKDRYKEDDEEDLTEEFKTKLEEARKTPLSKYINHEEVKKRILAKKR